MLPAFLREKLSNQVLCATLGLLALVLATASMLDILREERNDLGALEERGAQLVAHAALLFAEPLENGRFKALDELVRHFTEEGRGIDFTRVTLPGGLIVSQFPLAGSNDPRLRAGGLTFGGTIARSAPLEEEGETSEEGGYTGAEESREEAFHASQHPTLAGRVQVGLATSSLEQAAAARREAAILKCLAAMAATGLALWFFLKRRMDLPLRQLGERAIDLGRQRFDKPIHVRGEDEVGMLTDALERMRRDLVIFLSEREKQTRESAELTRLKEEYLAYGASELKAPIERMLEILGALSSSPQREIAPLLGCAQSLRARVAQVLSFLRQAGAEVPLSEEPIELAQACAHSVQAIAFEARDKGIELACNVEPGLEIRTDPDLLDQLLSNLLDNALRLSEEGRITLEARRAAEDCLVIRVEDTGRGIPTELHESIFERLQSGFRPGSREYQGSWIALAVAKRSIDALGGVIQLDSTPGYGCTITTVLPTHRGIDPEELRAHLREFLTVQIRLEG